MNNASTLPVAAWASLEAAVNAALALDPDTLERLRGLAGTIIGIELQGLGVTIHVLPGSEGLTLMSRFEGEPDAVLSGTPLALLGASLSDRPANKVMSGEITVRGDNELAQRFQAVLQNVDIDWEEHVSRLAGDLVAHQAGSFVRGLAQWGGRVAESVGMNLAEYLQEENRALPSRFETEQFLTAVDDLRNDTERLEARLKRLRRRLDEGAGEGPGK